MATWRMLKLALFASIWPGAALGQWSPDNPIENAPAKDNIPSYVHHATYLANQAPAQGPVQVGYNYHLPPDYEESDARYPVIYQLGGHTDNESIGLVDRGLPNRYQEKMADGSLRPVINVYVNGPGTLESYSQLEATVIDELIPHIDGKFRTLTTRECRHIEGYSRGGSGAPLFAFRHPELFSVAVSNAGSGTENITDALPALKSTAMERGLRLLVTILEGDHLYPANQEFCRFLDEQQIPYDYVSAPGGSHDTNKYFNDPQTYAAIGYGNILWHERAFAEQGCSQPPGGGGGGGGGGGSSGGGEAGGGFEPGFGGVATGGSGGGGVASGAGGAPPQPLIPASGGTAGASSTPPSATPEPTSAHCAMSAPPRVNHLPCWAMIALAGSVSRRWRARPAPLPVR